MQLLSASELSFLIRARPLMCLLGRELCNQLWLRQ